MEDETPQMKGGRARSEKLSPEERSRIAREAAKKRWREPTPEAIYGAPDKPIRIADIEVPCFVLDDNRRVIPTVGMLNSLAIARGGSMIKGMNRLELFVSRERIKPYVSIDLESVSKVTRSALGGGP